MKNKRLLILFVIAISIVCMFAISPLEINAQTAKKIVKRKTVKRKKIVRKTTSPKTVETSPAFAVSEKDTHVSVINKASDGSPPPKILTFSTINGKAINLVTPTYPPAAKAVRASGAVNVQVTIDEQGNVISVSAVSGHPLLRQSAEQAARASKFSPTLLGGQPVKVTGIVLYNFTAQ